LDNFYFTFIIYNSLYIIYYIRTYNQGVKKENTLYFP